MERELAISVVTQIKDYIKSRQGKYKIETYAEEGSHLKGFHWFVDERDQVGTYKIQQAATGETYYFVFPDFLFTGIFYLVIYPSNRANPLLCIHKVEEAGAGQFNLCWAYIPTRRDGKNLDRKRLFDKYYHGPNAEIKLPGCAEEVELFTDEIFRLCNARIQADNLMDSKA